jgi:hypothetical protein
MRVSTEERVVLGPREVRAADIQEKMGGVPHSQAHGTEQVTLLECPGSKVPRMRMWGVCVTAGEERRTHTH